MHDRMTRGRPTSDAIPHESLWPEPGDGQRVTRHRGRDFLCVGEAVCFAPAELRLLADLAELHAMECAAPHRVVALVLNPLDWEASGRPACIRDARGRFVPVRVGDAPPGSISIDFEKIKPYVRRRGG